MLCARFPSIFRKCHKVLRLPTFAPFHRWMQMRFAKTTQHQASKVLRLQLKNGAPATKNQSPLLINLKRIVRVAKSATPATQSVPVTRLSKQKLRPYAGASTPPPPDPPKIYYSINESPPLHIREQINWGILNTHSMFKRGDSMNQQTTNKIEHFCSGIVGLLDSSIAMAHQAPKMFFHFNHPL